MRGALIEIRRQTRMQGGIEMKKGYLFIVMVYNIIISNDILNQLFYDTYTIVVLVNKNLGFLVIF